MAQIATLKTEDIVKLLPKNMAQIVTRNFIHVNVPLKHPAQVFHTFSKEAYLLPSLSPANVKKMELVSGHWGEVGSVRDCTYVVQGSTEKLVDQVTIKEELHPAMIMAYKVLGGDMAEHFNNIDAFIKVVKLNGSTSYAIWGLAYDLKDSICPSFVYPDSYLKVLKAVTEDVDNKVN